MKKKKQARQGQFSQKQMEANFLALLETACGKMAGKGFFKKFSPLCKLRMTENRLATVKLKAAPAAGISAAELKYYNEVFTNQLAGQTVTTLTGETMSLGSFLREGMTLICYSEIILELGAAHAGEIYAAFKGYQRDVFTRPLLDLVELLHRMGVLLGDWSTKVLEYNIESMFAFSGDSAANHVGIDMVKPKAVSVNADGISRRAIPVSWPDYDGPCTQLSINPAEIGLAAKTNTGQRPLPVYIQHHALRKLEERIGIIPGLMHYALFDNLKPGRPKACHVRGSASLVEYKIYGRKLGHLLCSVHDEKILVRTFLFLTNDSTPEAKKLSGLTRLQILDKKFLGIDTLPGFLRFGIAEDALLSELFTQAGCQSLLDLHDLQVFCVSELTARDPLLLLNYLRDTGQTD